MAAKPENVFTFEDLTLEDFTERYADFHLIFSQSRDSKKGSVFCQDYMNGVFMLVAFSGNDWHKDKQYCPVANEGVITLSHDVCKIFDEDKKFAGYAVLGDRDENIMPHILYCFSNAGGRYVLAHLERNRTYTFELENQAYCFHQGVVTFKSAVAKKLREEGEKSVGCFPSVSDFFNRRKRARSRLSLSGSQSAFSR